MKSLKENLKDLNLETNNNNLNIKNQSDAFLDANTNSKKQNVEFSKFIQDIEGVMSDKVKDRIFSCGDFLQFLADEKIEYLKLENANFCGHRFCPQCSANKAREDAIELATLVEYVKQELGYEFIFLTLTAPNIGAEEVEQELKEYYEAFTKLFKNKKVKAISKGYIRKLEMTYNAETDTYHPHYHVLIAVNKSYFTDKDYYISQKEWLKMWRKAKRDDSITQVDVRKFKSKDDIFKSVLELSKYIAKDSDYMHSPDVFRVFYRTLKGKRMLSFSGCFKEGVKLYKSGDLLKYMGEDPNEGIEYVKRLWYSWNSNEYDNVNVVDLNPEEVKEANLTREERFTRKKKLKAEIAKLNAEESKARKEELAKVTESRNKTIDFETGEMELPVEEKKQILLEQEQKKFEELVEKFNEKQKRKLKSLE